MYISLTEHCSTSEEFTNYLATNLFPGANQSVLEHIDHLYPNNVSDGSPFGTGTANALTPEFKRLAAFLGDYAFQAPRRFLMTERPEKIKAWSRREFIKLAEIQWLSFDSKQKREKHTVPGSRECFDHQDRTRHWPNGLVSRERSEFDLKRHIWLARLYRELCQYAESQCWQRRIQITIPVDRMARVHV